MDKARCSRVGRGGHVERRPFNLRLRFKVAGRQGVFYALRRGHVGPHDRLAVEAYPETGGACLLVPLADVTWLREVTK